MTTVFKYKDVIKFQLLQIIVYQKKVKFDFRFKKLRNLDFWENKPEGKISLYEDGQYKDKHMFETLKEKLFTDGPDETQNKHLYTAFLKQTNVIKHVQHTFNEHDEA